MEIQSPIYLLTIVLVFFSTWIILRLRRRSSPSRSPPGPWKLPLIGNLHNLIGDVPHRVLHQLAQKHGPLMQLQLGEISAVMVSSADAAQEVMKTHDINFASRPPILAAEIVGYGCTSISFSPYGHYWRQLRKICTMELLSLKRVHSFRSLRATVFLDLTKRIASMEGSAIDLTEELYASTYAVTAAAALGKKTKELEAFLPIIKRVIVLAAGFDVAELFPSIKLIRKISGCSRKLLRVHNEADRILDHIIHHHKSKLPNSDADTTQDLLDVLLTLQEDGLELPLTNDNIKAVILVSLATRKLNYIDD